MDRLIETLLLDKVVSFFKRQGERSNKVPMTWAIKIASAVAALAFIAYLVYKSRKRSKELAKLRSYRDIAKERANQAKTDWELAKIDDKIDKKLKKVQESVAELVRLSEELDQATYETVYEGVKIEAIKNWNDMASYLDGISSEPIKRR